MDDATRATTAGLFLMTTAESFNVISALSSSPWTVEAFGADDRRAASAKKYVMHAICIDLALGLGASMIARNPAPMIGMIVAAVYIWWLYSQALGVAAEQANTGWADAS